MSVKELRAALREERAEKEVCAMLKGDCQMLRRRNI